MTNNSSATSERGAPFGVQVYVDDNKVGRFSFFPGLCGILHRLYELST